MLALSKGLFRANTIARTTRMSSSFVTTINSKNAPPAVGPYSHAVKANGFIYVSGQIPYTSEGKPVEGDIKVKADKVINNALAILNDAGSQLEKIVKVNVFLADMENFGKFNEVYSTYFSEHKPARSCVAVKQLPLGVEVEMEVIAIE
ncbi:isoleucine biosynthesis protein [Martiniozyma asiatica (nom. inval.)]|nr:isoleucine biosynthesis protein [Martiniozyma asiatica]